MKGRIWEKRLWVDESLIAIVCKIGLCGTCDAMLGQ